MAKPRLDEYGRPTEIYYERGTKPLGKPLPLPRNTSGSALSSSMDGREDSVRAWKNTEEPGKKKPRHRAYPGRNAFQHEKARALESVPRSEMPDVDKKIQTYEPGEEKIRPRLDVPFKLQFRAIEPDDFHFVLNAWMRSYRDSMRNMVNDAYFHGQQNLIAELAKRRQLVIGIDAETPKWIAGFACGVQLEDGRMIMDYLYVKHAYRERGIARGLLGALGWMPGQEIVATHKTRAVEPCFLRYNATFNPYFNQIGFSDV